MLVAEAAAELLAVADKWRNIADLASEVGNITAPFAAAHFQAANNTVFDVAVGREQAFHDQVVAIDAALTTAVDATLRGRLMSVYQGE